MYVTSVAVAWAINREGGTRARHAETCPLGQRESETCSGSLMDDMLTTVDDAGESSGSGLSCSVAGGWTLMVFRHGGERCRGKAG